MQKAADWICRYHLLHIWYIAYRDTVNELSVTHISQLANFAGKIGGGRETGPANRNYTELAPIGITHQPLPPGLAWAGDTAPPPPSEGSTQRGNKRQYKKNHEEKQTYCLIVTSHLQYSISRGDLSLLRPAICCAPVEDSSPSADCYLLCTCGRLINSPPSALSYCAGIIPTMKPDSTPPSVSHCAKLIPV